MDIQCHLQAQELEAYAAQVFGAEYRPVKTSRLYGGAQKVIYKVDFANGFVCLLYVWDIAMNYFQQEIENGVGSAGASYGAGLFAMNHAFLTKHGIRTPELYGMNRERSRYPFDFAFVEYIDGPNLETSLSRSSAHKAEALMSRFASMLGRMHSIESRTYGKIEETERHTAECHRLQLQNAQDQLAFAATHIGELAVQQERLLRKLHDLESRIKPRQRYAFIHGELGPDHVLVKDRETLYLIDIEGAEFHDAEHEHSFLQIRFGNHYKHLRSETLDEDRLQFYLLHQRISLTAGGLKLMQRGFHDQELAQRIRDHNLRGALGFLA